MANLKLNNIQLKKEEIKTLKLFLSLFYFLLIAYDVFYYYVFRYYEGTEMGLPDGGLGFWFHVFLILFLPASIYIAKKGKVYIIKYIYLIGYIFLDIVNNLLIYLGSDLVFNSGNAVEIFFILFSPIFINKRFFWFSLTGMILKYVLLGIILSAVQVLIPIVLYVVLSAVAYIFLSRFNSNLETRLRMNDELRHTEKLAAVGRFATSISHEVRNPLASLKGFTQLQHEKHPEDSEYYTIMINEIERISSLLDDLLVIGKPKGMNFESLDIQEIIEYVAKVMENDARNLNVSINLKIEDTLSLIECDGKHLKQVLINLVKNGMEAMPEGGEITIKAEMEGSDRILLSVRDEGLGIAEKDLEMLGTAFHTTKSDGTGLGLMVSFKIIEEHHGAIHYESVEGDGTTVSIQLPVTQPNL
ncbi:two-component sensor histidine kinase [Bacillus salacetis]|uniref:histidine kinase n=1 Tax=Bacillus salacetis TaxID=2315464 RepID=A0A3A1QT67_9BACI|nr:ATP-binding protein [Bacillus salacetis]RIW30881.1 two-component sensor histidine kinase [Bacillus salacetis]